MENLNDIKLNIRERISNPLIFSFLISWLVVNWQITVGLVWFNSTQIEKAGYSSIFEFIKAKITVNDSLWHPLVFAISYTLLMPILKNLIQAFNSWATKWGENWNLKILNESKISINRYFKLRGNYEKRSKLLEDVISKESEYITNYDSVKTELLKTKSQNNDLLQRLTVSETYVRQSSDITILNGFWESNYEIGNNTKGVENIFIENGYYYVISALGEKEHKFDIRHFYYDNRNDNLFFVKELTSEGKKVRPIGEFFTFNQLKFEGKDMMKGRENEWTKIVYKRK